uniref:E n=1 Tax=Porcine reproductive and respiratory syndrome virus TaxID=28344 RepID=A0A6G8QUD6_PRRSV|nr:E [Porcine reproductive and respiratory syndrome virus] [Porcine reproductive and respiratory syndrome virus]QIN91221.1 E [Porcine reproductive and respiratory syndrome virus] [Porcine reproductive and respiratory syndrome virus]QIN91229.1 E [Porcine reproductive and respiratory syndrome virus] [Porcine reproductive and respiratory syndrome virus]QIN91237.1 E [Porcine reproductive and respiratory syndrome virus] [Porcine reproductive and respiratory syndrome virus]QIN91245.1 E [Porcine repro
MGSLWSQISQLFVDAFTEFLVSVVDIVIFLAILFGFTVAGWLLVFLLRVVCSALLRSRSAIHSSELSKVL